MKKVIVTGANGFVGRNLVRILEANGVKVIAVDSRASNISKYKNITCNLDESNKLPDLITDRDIECCIHLAWQGSTGSDRGDYGIQLKNIQRSLLLCDSISLLGIKRFVGIGSLAEKDISAYIPTDGSTPNKVALYGVAKQTAHYMTKIECSSRQIEHIWCQLSNIYGVGDYSNNFINYASKIMMNHQRASFTAGEQMYDFVYITDIANAIYLCADKGKAGVCYYLGSGNPRKLKCYIEDIRDAIDSSITLHLGEVPFNGISLSDSEFDCSKLINDTGFVPTVSFAEGIKSTIKWIKEN